MDLPPSTLSGVLLPPPSARKKPYVLISPTTTSLLRERSGQGARSRCVWAISLHFQEELWRVTAPEWHPDGQRQRHIRTQARVTTPGCSLSPFTFLPSLSFSDSCRTINTSSTISVFSRPAHTHTHTQSHRRARWHPRAPRNPNSIIRHPLNKAHTL